MALLGLVGLLHPGGPAILSIQPRGRSLRLPLEARKRAGATQDTWRVVVRRMIGPPQIGCQTDASSPGEASGRARRPFGSFTGSTWAPPHAYPLGVCAIRLATPSWPVLSSPGPRRRRRSRETPAGLVEGRRQRSSGLVEWTSIGRSTAPALRPSTLAAALYQCRQPERRSYRTNGRQAGLASCPG
jgi:hypothetical protein